MGWFWWFRKPTLEVSGGFTKTLTFYESKTILEASLDWALDGIYNDIYNEADLAGFVTKADISVLAGYTVRIGDEELSEIRYYDPNASENNDAGDTGKVIFVESDDFELSGSFTNTGLIVGLVIGAVALIGGGVFLVLKFKK